MTTGTDKRRLTILLIVFILVISLGVFLYVFGVPIILTAVQEARDASKREQCENNLKQVEAALAEYGNEAKTLETAPPSGKQGKGISPFDEVLSQGLVVSEGVVYKKAGPEVNRKALEKLSQAFVMPDRKTASDYLFDKILICGPGLWQNIKDDAEMKEIKTGVTKLKMPMSTGMQVLEGKLFQGKQELDAFWRAYLRKYKSDPQVTIRRPTAKELDIYWAMISYDITEPIFMIESKDATILAQFTDKEVTIGWIDDYKGIDFQGE